MSLSTALLIGFAALTGLGVVGIVRHHTNPRREKPLRGIEPGQGDTLVYAKERTAFFGTVNEDAAGRMTRVTKDPQAYARGFVPGRRK